MCRMNCCSLPDHTIKVDRYFRNQPFLYRFLEYYHYFLAPTHRKSWNESNPPSFHGILDYHLQVSFCVLKCRLKRVRIPISSFTDNCFNSRKPINSRVEKPGFLILVVTRNNYIMKPVSNMEMGNCRT